MSASLHVDLQTQSLDLAPGQPASVQVRVVNTGTVALDTRLRVAGLGIVGGLPSEPLGRLVPGGALTTVLHFTLPRESAAGERRIAVQIEGARPGSCPRASAGFDRPGRVRRPRRLDVARRPAPGAHRGRGSPARQARRRPAQPGRPCRRPPAARLRRRRHGHVRAAAPVAAVGAEHPRPWHGVHPGVHVAAVRAARLRRHRAGPDDSGHHRRQLRAQGDPAGRR